MKTLQFNAIVTGIRSKVDRSLGLTLATPEMEPEEAAEFMRLQGRNIVCLFKPMDEQNAPVQVIDKELNLKTQGQRLRNTLYVWWQQLGGEGTFEDFYKDKMERIIDNIKEKLD